ncbi:MAG: hypothetical protein KAS72_07950 [Phycisphaerales bacterium]|nr:hypothetical protein [Phycisphaerales bacterium]
MFANTQANPTSGRHIRTASGLVVGLSAALLLYLWQANIQLAIATFVIVTHAATVAVHCHNAAMIDVRLRRELSQMHVNAPHLRLARMVIDLYFWWSMCFGIGSIMVACWFAGLRLPSVLVLIAIAWAIISVMLGYGTTLLYPTTRCRICGYQLIGQLDQTNPDQRLTCPECGHRWTKVQLCLVPPGWKQGMGMGASITSTTACEDEPDREADRAA